ADEGGQGSPFARPCCEGEQGHAHLRQIRGGGREAAALGVHRRGDELLGSDRRSQDRQGEGVEGDYRRRRSDRRQGAGRGHGVREDVAGGGGGRGGQGQQG